MPRTYKPSGKKIYKKYEELVIEQALEEYNKDKKSLAVIAEKYHISKSVLHRHKTYNVKKQGGQTALTSDMEEYLVENINICSEWGYPLDTFDLRMMVKCYLDKLGQNVRRFKDNMPGIDFIKSFLKRHTDKMVSLSQNIKRARAAVSPERIGTYFDELEISLEGVPLSNVVNYDETSLSNDPERKEVIIKRSVKYPERVMSHTQSSISIMMAAAADGTLLPAYVVYKAEHIYNTWTQNGPKGCRYNRTKSGWFDGPTFEDWVKTIIIPYFKNKPGPKILIGDNLSTHLTIDLIRDCKEQGIAFIFLPANSTNLTHPLDIAFFRPMKRAWHEILYNWKNTDGIMQASVPNNTFPSLFKTLLARLENNISQNILSGFEKCGISPINRHEVLERLAGNAVREEDQCYEEAIDQAVLTMLQDMRYETGSTTPRIPSTYIKEKKIEVIPGRSVCAAEDFECEDSDETNTDNDSDVTSDISSAGEESDSETQEGKFETIFINSSDRQKTEARNSDRIKSKTDKSLINKTKVNRQCSIEHDENRNENGSSSSQLQKTSKVESENRIRGETNKTNNIIIKRVTGCSKCPCVITLIKRAP